ISSVPSSSSRAEICLLTAGCPIPRSFATAEKLPFSTNRTNICIASNLSTRTSIPLWNRFYAKSNDSPACCPFQDRGQKKPPPSRHVFLFGIAGIPHCAKSVCNAAHQYGRRLNQRSAESCKKP